MGEALDGNKEAVATFQKLDVAIKDGNGEVRELGDVIPEVADAFEKMGSDQERTAAAMKIFGRSGASLLPLLKQGGQGLREMNEQFEALGLGIDEDFIKKADEAGDQIDILKLGFRALKTRIATDALPVITEWAKKMQKGIVAVRDFVKETNVLKYAWTLLSSGFAIGALKIATSWGKTLGLLGGNKNIISTIFSMGQLGLIAIAFVLIALAIEDIVTMCKGGNSVIGPFLDEMLGVEYRKELVESLTKAWRDLQPALLEIGPAVKQVALEFVRALPYIIAFVLDAVKAVYTLTDGLYTLGGIIAKIGRLKFDGIGADLDGLNSRRDSLWKGGSTFAKVVGASSEASVPVASDFAPGTVTVGDTAINVNVYGPPNAPGTGRAIAGSVRDGINGSDMARGLAALQSGPE